MAKSGLLDMSAKDEASHVTSEGGTKHKVKSEYKTDFEKAFARKEQIIQAMKSVKFNIDEYLGSDPSEYGKCLAYNKMPKLVELNPILKKKLIEKQLKDQKNDTRKVYTFEEYYKKFVKS